LRPVDLAFLAYVATWTLRIIFARVNSAGTGLPRELSRRKVLTISIN
jgi:hypothetical protein